ncbi:MAG: class I SAM-dependent methyltransferase [Elusimicrobia bacterium]|nr:class I SAM-dependent methyltransferase [Elusimicrobiota bacterium]
MSGGTEEAFGFAWDFYHEIIPLHKEQFEGWITPLPLSFFAGKRFLDAGCGIGRNSLWALEAGAASGRAFDFDPRTVAVARRNLAGHPSCAVDLCSIYDLEAGGGFDIAFCIGVLQHLQRPKDAVRRLVDALEPGGTLILWVYAREGNEGYLRWADPLRHYVTSRIHPALTLALARALTALLWLRLRLPSRDRYLGLLAKRSFRHMEAMVFDQLLPHISHYWSRPEVLSLVEGLPVRVRHLTHTHAMSWTLVAEKQ